MFPRPAPIRARTLALVALFGAGCGEPGVELDHASIDTTSRGAILGTADWDSIVAFESDPIFARGARLGRSVGAMVFDLPDGTIVLCSAFLIDDEYVVSAYHCYEYAQTFWDAANQTQTGPQARFVPGRYGTSHMEGLEDLGHRLEDLGVPRTIAQQKAAAIRQGGFDCYRDPTYRNYGGEIDDVDLYRCSNEIVVHTQGSRLFVTYVAPGHLVGHIDVAPPAVLSSLAPDDRIYLLSYNRLDLSTGSQGSILLSPGGIVTEVYRSCVAGRAGDCFRSRRDDHASGSSGGPVLLEGDDVVVGIIQGQNAAQTRNSNTHLDASIYDRTQTPPTIHPLPSNVVSGYTPLAGGVGGAYQRLDCPVNYLAHGIVARDRAESNGREVVTTFGLVCVPHNISERILDRAVVIAGGSIDIAYASSVVEDLSAFEKRHDVSVTMCPERYYMTGMSVATNQYLEHVFAIACRGPSGDTVTRAPRDAVGRYSYPANIAALDCGERFVKRLDIRSGWYTNAVRFGCVPAP